jgi:hypothetical protein
VLIVGFVALGAVAYHLTAPAAANESGFSLGKIIEHVRSEIRGQNYVVSLTRSIAAPAGREVRVLKVGGFRAKLTLVGESRDDVAAEVKGTVYGSDEPQARALADRIVVSLTPTDDTIELRVELPEDIRRRPRLDVRVMLPSRLAVRLALQGGEVEAAHISGVAFERGVSKAVLQEIDGPVTGELSGGSLELMGATGVELETHRTELRLSDIHGPLTLEADRGDIRVRGIKGTVTLKLERAQAEVEDVAGPVTVEGESASLRIRDVSASVNIHGERLELILEPQAAVPLQATTTGGHIELALPRDGVQLRANVEHGEIRATTADVQIETATEEHRSHATLDGDGPLISLTVKDGDILIR